MGVRISKDQTLHHAARQMLRTIRQQRWDSRHIAMASGWIPTDSWKERIAMGAGTPVQLCETGLSSTTLDAIISAYSREPHRKPGSVFGGGPSSSRSRIEGGAIEGKKNEEIAVAGMTSGGGFSREFSRGFWDGIDDALRDSMARCVGLYVGTGATHVPGLRGNKRMRDEAFRIKRYENGTRESEGGFHDWHIDDYSPAGSSSGGERRQLAFILYLNHVQVGGETEIRGFGPVHPRAGQALLFPTGEGFVHRGREPLSEPKMVATNFIISE